MLELGAGSLFMDAWPCRTPGGQAISI